MTLFRRSTKAITQAYGALTHVVGGLWTRFNGQGYSKIRMLLPSARFDWEREAGDVWTNSIVALAIAWLGDRFSRPLMHVSKVARNGDYIPQGRHPVTDLWDRPNKHYGRRTLEKACGLSLKVDGNAYLYKVRDRLNRVVELWWIPHYIIYPTWPYDGTEFIDGYRIQLDTVQYWVPASEIIHIRDGIDPRNERLGLSAARAAIREVVTVNMESGYTAALLKNSGVPGLAIVPDDPLVRPNKEDAEAIKERFHDNFSGDNAGSTVVLAGKYKIVQVGISPEQLMLDRLPQAAMSRISGACGVAMMSMGLADPGKTYANLQEANKTSWGTIVAVHELVAEALRWQLLPDFGLDPYVYLIEYDYTHVQELQESLDAVHARSREDWKAGGIRLNEYREQIGMEPDVDGDRWYPGTDASAAPAAPPDDGLGGKRWKGYETEARDDQGQWTGSGGEKPKPHRLTKKEKADRVRKGKPAAYNSEKAALAAASQNKTDAKVQRFTKANEFKLASKLGGKAFPNNGPTDVEVEGGGVNGKVAGLEIKTMTHGTNDRINMKPDALARKYAWEKKNKSQMSTIVHDVRNAFDGGANAGTFSGHEYYYKRGLGNMRIGAMYKARDHAEILTLMKTPYNKLPAAARGATRGHKL